MKVCILGWYGTETLGDRAILSGILSLLAGADVSPQVLLGAIQPFFTHRTLAEDGEWFNKQCGRQWEIEVFDSKRPRILKNAISRADVVMVGGGPLMDIADMYMLAYGFRAAKKMKKATMIFGCGVGPLTDKNYIKAFRVVVENTDQIVWRGNHSAQTAERLAGDLFKTKKPAIAIDPAALCVADYLQHYGETVQRASGEDAVVNVRVFPHEYAHAEKAMQVKIAQAELVKQLAASESYASVRLVPMHYFHIGGDDRVILSKIRFRLGSPQNVVVQQKPLTLLETLDTFRTAKANAGMRFHAVVLQTLLNGNNVVLDYTGRTGKTGGFLNAVGGNDFYSERYADLTKGSFDPKPFVEQLETGEHFQPDWQHIHSLLNLYAKAIKAL